jgi:hypothetical protein
MYFTLKFLNKKRINPRRLLRLLLLNKVFLLPANACNGCRDLCLPTSRVRALDAGKDHSLCIRKRGMLFQAQDPGHKPETGYLVIR